LTAALFSVTAHGEGVASLRIATRNEPYLGADWVDGFCRALAGVGADPDVRALILEGDGTYFSAGASREALLSGAADTASYAARAPLALLDLEVPAVAAVAGHAVGGGLLLALWCDAAVLAEESLYGANFMALGFTPGMGATYAVPEAFGEPLGRELLLTGRLVTGREIRQGCCPLSHAVRPRADVLPRAAALAGEIADAPREAVVALKRNLAGRRRTSLERAAATEKADISRSLADSGTRYEIARRYPSPMPPGSSGP
jgi:polyketide biosynthesis enoyl-CoA hydratase PksI